MPDAITYDKYAVVSIRGVFTRAEANLFLTALLDSPSRPSHEPFFQRRPLTVHALFYYTFPNDPRASVGAMRHYMDYFSALDFVSQYEWQVARRDLDYIIKSPANTSRSQGLVFGAIPTDQDD